LVGRELRKRIARAFSERAIHLPTPRMVVDLRRHNKAQGARHKAQHDDDL
jgi:hypothetical protein